MVTDQKINDKGHAKRLSMCNDIIILTSPDGSGRIGFRKRDKDLNEGSEAWLLGRLACTSEVDFSGLSAKDLKEIPDEPLYGRIFIDLTDEDIRDNQSEDDMKVWSDCIGSMQEGDKAHISYTVKSLYDAEKSPSFTNFQTYGELTISILSDIGIVRASGTLVGGYVSINAMFDIERLRETDH